MKDLWNQERSCPGHALMMLPKMPRRKKVLSDKAPERWVESGLSRMVLTWFCLCRHQVTWNWERLGIFQSEEMILQLGRARAGEVSTHPSSHGWLAHRCPLWVPHERAMASPDSGRGHLQPEGPAKPADRGPQEMVLKRGLVLGAEGTDSQEGDNAVVMSSCPSLSNIAKGLRGTVGSCAASTSQNPHVPSRAIWVALG